jgi:hypothetical protein
MRQVPMDMIDEARAIAADVSRGGLRCDFCGKSRREVRGLVQAEAGGPTICNECVGLALGIFTRAGLYP